MVKEPKNPFLFLIRFGHPIVNSYDIKVYNMKINIKQRRLK